MSLPVGPPLLPEVIPREGVESLQLFVLKLLEGRHVIPREGVESKHAELVHEPRGLPDSRDPERGS